MIPVNLAALTPQARDNLMLASAVPTKMLGLLRRGGVPLNDPERMLKTELRRNQLNGKMESHGVAVDYPHPIARYAPDKPTLFGKLKSLFSKMNPLL